MNHEPVLGIYEGRKHGDMKFHTHSKDHNEWISLTPGWNTPGNLVTIEPGDVVWLQYRADSRRGMFYYVRHATEGERAGFMAKQAVSTA